MKHEYLTRLVNLIATYENRSGRLTFYHQYEGAYTALFLTQVLTTDEFLFYSELGRIILGEIFE